MAISAGTKKFQPTEAQRAAIESISIPMAVDAAAGSGKTAVLIRRILRIVGCNPSEPGMGDWARLACILAITFTEKAAGELRAKLRSYVPPAERFRLDQAWVGTFHSFAARLLRRHGPVVGLSPSFDILDENAAGLLTRKCVRDSLLKLLEKKDNAAVGLIEEIGFATAVGALEELMQFRWHAEKALKDRTGAEAWEKKALDALQSVFAKAQSFYAMRLSELGALDFQELEIRALKLLGNESIACSCRRIFAHILVDEFQDTNDIQTELVLKLFDPAINRLFIVGDEAQSIYRFRGANVSCFARVRGEISQRRGRTIRLAHNFRSRKSIISFVNLSQEVLAQGLFADPSAPKPMEAAAGDEGKIPSVIELAIPPSEEKNIATLREREAGAMADMILAYTASGKWSLGDVVLLFRAMTSADIYENALYRRLVPCTSSGGRGFLERREVADLMAAIRFACDQKDGVALLTLLRSPIAGLSDDELVLMAGKDGRDIISTIEKYPGTHFKTRRGEDCPYGRWGGEPCQRHGEGVSPSEVASRRTIRTEQQGFEMSSNLSLISELGSMAAHMRPSEIMRRVINEAGLEALWLKLDPSGTANMNMDRLVTIARELEREMPTTLSDFNSFMEEMRKKGARFGDSPAGADSRNAVRLMTVHAAKGLEFPVVFLPDLMRPLPRNNSQWIFSRGDAGNGGGVSFRKRNPDQPFGSRIATERFTRLADEEALQEGNELRRLLYVAMTRAAGTLVLPMHEGIKAKDTWHEWVSSTLNDHNGRDVAKRIEAHSLQVKGKKKPAPVHVTTCAPAPQIKRGASAILSVSALDSYSVCPMQYYLKYVLGLPASEKRRDDEDCIEPNIYGSIVHAMLSAATEDAALLRAAAVSAGLASGVKISERNMKSLLCDAQKATELAYRGRIKEGFRELPFELTAERSIISGTIDWLLPVERGFEVIDFKTGLKERSKAEAVAAQYEMQMQAYSLAAEAITGKEVVSTTLVFPSANITVRREMYERRRNQARRSIVEIVSAIEACNFAVRKAPPCEGCVFHRNGMCWIKKRDS